MSDPIRLFRSTSGLNTVDTEHNAHVDTDKGVIELVTASNIDVSDSGKIVRRVGKSLLRTGTVTNIACDKSFGLAQIDDALVFLSDKLGTIDLLTGTPSTVEFTTLPGRIYFSYRYGDRGYVDDTGTIQPWEFTEVFDADNRLLSGPPSGITKICYHMGSMFVASDTIVYESEAYAPNVFSLSDKYIDFGAEVLDMYSAPSGFYVVTKAGLFAHIGAGSSMQQKKVTSDTVLVGSLTYIEQFGSSAQDGVLGVTEKGVIFLSGLSMVYIGTDRINNIVGSAGSAYVNSTHYYCSVK